MMTKSTGKGVMYPCVKSEKVRSDHCDITRFELTSPVSIAESSFNALRHLHQLECDPMVKFAYKLSLKALNPSTFERQNVIWLCVYSTFQSLKPWSNMAASTTFCIGIIPTFTLK